MAERNLKDEFERLNIVAFDCNDITTKSDVFTALDAIELHMKKNRDIDALSHIEKLRSEKAARRFKGGAE